MFMDSMKKYYHKMSRYILNIACPNIFIVYKNNGGKLERLDFLISLRENLAVSYFQPLLSPSRPTNRPKPTFMISIY
jgi:hypothetical protein